MLKPQKILLFFQNIGCERRIMHGKLVFIGKLRCLQTKNSTLNRYKVEFVRILD